MLAWLRLLRWKNLLIVFCTQLLAWACVLVPMLHYTASPILLHPFNFFCLALSTVLIAGAGYIINDYFDIKIDIINRPEKVVLEKRIPRRMAIISHTVLNIVALLLAGYVAKQVHAYGWLLFQFSCTVMLWFYSTTFKRRFMIGNVVVALLTAFTILVLMLYEPAIHYYVGRGYFINTANGLTPNPVWVLGIYAYFAFMLTWMREIVKDMEDFKGDAEQGCMTMPIKWGLQRSVHFIQALAVLVMLPLIGAAVKLYLAHWWPLATYTIVALIVPLIIWCFFLPQKATSQHYSRVSTWLKIIMVLGIGSLIIYFIQAYV